MPFLKKKAPKLYPTHMVVGLGNPGPEYKGTRHNVGFEVVETLAERHGAKLNTNRQQALVAEVDIHGVPTLLVKPLTYMNLSGRAVLAHARHHNIKPEKILVVADDLDLPTGKLRMRANGSSGGHNGHKSIANSLATQDYPRLKIGISNDGETVDHVLSKFTPEERATINPAVQKAADAAEKWLADGPEKAMNFANAGD